MQWKNEKQIEIAACLLSELLKRGREILIIMSIILQIMNMLHCLQEKAEGMKRERVVDMAVAFVTGREGTEEW